MKKVAIYARVSTEEQKKNYSIGEQISQLKAYCKLHNYDLVEEYVDPGFTGSNMNRPGLTKLLNDVDYFDAVIVWKLDRLSRSIIDTMTIIERDLLAKNVQFVALAENIDTNSSMWVTQAGIYSTIAQSEREAISERMKMGKIARAKSGKPMSWVHSPFGYRYNKEKETYDINPVEADIVKAMFETYEAIGSITRLRNHLNDDGHIGKNVKWSYRTVKQTLENPVYAGYNRYKGEVFKGNHEPIVDKELFERAQNLMEERRINSAKTNNPRPFQTKYMLSGQIACGYCSTPLEIMWNIRANGDKNYRYGCRNRRVTRGKTVIYNNGEMCDAKIHSKDEIEMYVIDEINKLQLNHDLIHEYSADNGERLAQVADYEKKLSKNKRDTDKLIKLYMHELISSSELESKSDSLKKEKRYLNTKLNEIKKEDNKALKYLEKENRGIKDMDYNEQKLVVETLIDKVIVKDDGIVIRWQF